MKKIILLFLTIYTFSFSIRDFNGINWGDSKENLSILFSNLKKEPSINENVNIFSVKNPKENIKKYEFYLQNNALNKIRVVFDKESIGKRELQQIYNQLTTTIGVPVLKLPIYKEIDNLTLKGNTLKFVPDTQTLIYFTGIDTINELGKMTDSNLYLDYIPSQNRLSQILSQVKKLVQHSNGIFATCNSPLLH